MIFDELSNTVFRFPLRLMRAELEGGVQTPSPQYVVENHDARWGVG